MSSLRSLEIQLILACARSVPEPRKIQELVRFHLDWQWVLARVVEYGVAPLMYCNLKKVASSNLVSSEVLEQLKSFYFWCGARNTNLYCRLTEVLSAFAQARIPVIVLKGAALAELVYQNIALRPMRDLDLLVRREDLNAADDLLHTLHYVPNESARSREWYRQNHHHLAPYLAPDRSLVLELHHHIIPATALVDIPISDLWQRARPAKIASMPALILAPEDLLLHICLHASLVNNFAGMLRALCDVAETIRRYREKIDWTQLLRRTRVYEVGPYIYYTLWLAHSMVEAEVPQGVLKDLKASIGGRSWQGLSLKFLIPRAVFRHDQVTSLVASSVIYDACRELLSAQGTLNTIRGLLKRLARRLEQSANRSAPENRVLALLYTVLIYPFYLILRDVARLAYQRR